MAQTTFALANTLAPAHNANQTTERVTIDGVTDAVPVELLDDGFGPLPIYRITALNVVNPTPFHFTFRAVDDLGVICTQDIVPNTNRTVNLAVNEQFRWPRGEWGITIESNWAQRVQANPSH